MTVVVQCFHCNAILELDEGFRGGVCRCSTCGSLLQVPKGDASTGRKVRPAAPPPAPTPGGAAAQAAQASKSGDTGISSGKFDPRRTSVDVGGSSSGLGRIHKTKPISAAPAKGREAAAAKSPSRPSASGAPAAPVHGLPEIRAARRNTTLLWSSIVLIIAIAAVVIFMVLLWIFREPASQWTTPPPRPVSTSPAGLPV